MDLLNDYGKAFMFGIMLAAPIGPMALLTIRTTLCSGPLSGISTGFGAATGDAFYAMISFIGIASITSFFSSHKFYIQLIGSIFILIFAIHLFLNRNNITEELVCGIEDKRVKKHLKLFFTSVVLAIGNPPTISIFIAGTSMLNIFPTSIFESYTLTFIVWVSSFLWYIAVVFVIFYIRERSSLNFIQYLNTVSIVFMLLLSIWILINIFQ